MGEEASRLVVRAEGLACGRPGAEERAEPPRASLAAAATAAARAAACSDFAAMPALGGEVRGAFPEVGAPGDAWGNLNLCCPCRVEVIRGKGVVSESLRLVVKTNLRLFPEDRSVS